MIQCALNGWSLTLVIDIVGSLELLEAPGLPNQQLHDAPCNPSHPILHLRWEHGLPHSSRAKFIRSLVPLWIVSSKPLKEGHEGDLPYIKMYEV